MVRKSAPCNSYVAEICMIGDRLRLERERLGLTQPAFAEAADAKKRTLIDWEKGVSSPTAMQLAAMAVLGVDVLYVVTGDRSKPSAGLPRDQQALLNSYAMCSEPARRTLLQTAALLAAGVSPPPQPQPQGPGSVHQSNVGHGAVQIGNMTGSTPRKRK